MLERIREQAKTDPAGAARELMLGLMRGNAAEFKLGYTAENAAYATVDALEDVQCPDGLPGVSLAMVKAALTPPSTVGDGRWEMAEFLTWLADYCGWGTSEVIRVVEKPQDHWREYADFIVDREEGTQPAVTTAGAVA